MFFRTTLPCMNNHFLEKYALSESNMHGLMHILNEKTIRIGLDRFYFPQKRLYLNY